MCFVKDEQMRVKHNFFRRIAILLLLTMFSSVSFAMPHESIDKIKEVVQKFVTQNVKIEPGDTLDVQVSGTNSTFSLPICTTDINAALPKDANRNQITAVELTCNGARDWHVFVPVTVLIYSKVVVTRRPISARELLSEDDLDFAQADVSHLYNGFYKTKEDVIGLETSQMISPGTVLTKNNLQKPVLVHRSEVVNLEAGDGAVSVMMKGRAKSDGRLNEMIRVYNPTSERQLDAVVTGFGKAKVLS